MTLFRYLLPVLMLAAPALGDEAFYSIPAGDLSIGADAQWPGRSAMAALQFRSPRILMENGAEAYLLDSSRGDFSQRQQQSVQLVVRVDSEKAIVGTISFAADEFPSDGPASPTVQADGDLPDSALAARTLHFTAKAQSTKHA